MDPIVIIYFILVLVTSAYTIHFYLRDKNSYMKVACERLLSTIDCMDEKLDNLDEEIEGLYKNYSSNFPYVKKIYPNAATWAEDIVYRINGGFRYAKKLKKHVKEIKLARDRLWEKYPFSECSKYQQEILEDLKKIEYMDSEHSKNIIVNNLISRTKEEFVKLNVETKRNSKVNIISIVLTIVSIVVTIYSICK